MIHQNSQRRIYKDGYVYFITSSTLKRYPFFIEDLLCELFIENICICKELKKFKLYGFVILPDHFHMMLRPSEKNNVSEIIRSLKTNSSRDINRFLKSFNVGEVAPPRLRDRNINIFKWQKSYHDHVIRNESDFNNHLKYIWYNPVKHNLLKVYYKYKYSSYNNYQDLIDKIDL